MLPAVEGTTLMATCDMCKSQCSAYSLTDLRQMYRVDGVVDICRECATWAEKELSDIRRGQEVEMKRRICVKIGRTPAEADPCKYLRLLVGALSAILICNVWKILS